MSPVKPDRSCSRETRPPTSLGSWSLDEAQKKGKIAFVVVRVRGATCHSNKQPNKTLTLVRWFEIAADADAECGAVAWTIFPSFFFWLGGGKKHGAVHTAWTRSFTPSSIAHAVSAVDNPQLAVAGGCKLVASLPTEAYPIQPTSKYFACLPTCLSACLPSPSPSVGGSRARNDMGVRNDINRNILIYNTACYITFPPRVDSRTFMRSPLFVDTLPLCTNRKPQCPSGPLKLARPCMRGCPHAGAVPVIAFLYQKYHTDGTFVQIRGGGGACLHFDFDNDRVAMPTAAARRTS